ncbi:hypothetical protein Tco_0806334 [Tanacetum coccineum]
MESLVGNEGGGVVYGEGISSGVGEDVDSVCPVVGVFGSVCLAVGVFIYVCSIVCGEGKVGIEAESVTMGVVVDVDDGCEEEKGNFVSSKSTCLLVIVLCVFGS